MIDELPGVPLQRPHGEVVEPEPDAAAADGAVGSGGEGRAAGGERRCQKAPAGEGSTWAGSRGHE